MTTYIFIDASNLFYGGKKSLGWSIDYKKLKEYLENRFGASRIYYFGGVETHRFPFNYQEMDTVPLLNLKLYLEKELEQKTSELSDTEVLLLTRHLKRIRFFIKLEKLGYNMILKPVKTYTTHENIKVRKANCDVDMAYTIMREKNAFDTMLIVSGDGDFLPVLKYIRAKNKTVHVLSRADRTAKEIKQFAGNKFMDIKTQNMKNKIGIE